MSRPKRSLKQPARLRGFDLSGGVLQGGDDDFNVEGGDDEVPGLLDSEENGDESGEEEDGENDRTVVTNLNLGGERYDGGDDQDEGGPVEDPVGDGEDPAVLPHLPVLLDDGDLVNVDPGGQRGGGSAEAAFDELPLPSQGTQVVSQTQVPEVASLPALEEAHNQFIPTHKWPPKSVRPELSRTLTSLWQMLASSPENESLWIMQSIFFRCILPAGQGPDPGDTWSQVSRIRDRLRRWKAGECGQLWAEAKAGQEQNSSGGRRRKAAAEKENLSQEEKNARRCKVKAQEVNILEQCKLSFPVVWLSTLMTVYSKCSKSILLPGEHNHLLQKFSPHRDPSFRPRSPQRRFHSPKAPEQGRPA